MQIEIFCLFSVKIDTQEPKNISDFLKYVLIRMYDGVGRVMWNFFKYFFRLYSACYFPMWK